MKENGSQAGKDQDEVSGKAPSAASVSGDASKLLTTNEAAQLLNVSSQTILNYIERKEIPFIQLPGGGGRRRREFRIPMKGLLESLTGNYDPVQEINELAQSLTEDPEEE